MEIWINNSKIYKSFLLKYLPLERGFIVLVAVKELINGSFQKIEAYLYAILAEAVGCNVNDKHNKARR